MIISPKILILILLSQIILSIHLHPHKSTQKWLNYIWNKCDVDNDNFIQNKQQYECVNKFILQDYSENKAKIAKKALEEIESIIPPVSFENAVKITTDCDVNNNGKVNAQQLACIRQGFEQLWKLNGRGTGDQLVKIWRTCDKNQDNFISGQQYDCLNEFIFSQGGQKMSEQQKQQLHISSGKLPKCDIDNGVKVTTKCDKNHNNIIDKQQLGCIQYEFELLWKLS